MNGSFTRERTLTNYASMSALRTKRPFAAAAISGAALVCSRSTLGAATQRMLRIRSFKRVEFAGSETAHSLLPRPTRMMRGEVDVQFRL